MKMAQGCPSFDGPIPIPNMSSISRNCRQNQLPWLDFTKLSTKSAPMLKSIVKNESKLKTSIKIEFEPLVAIFGLSAENDAQKWKRELPGFEF